MRLTLYHVGKQFREMLCRIKFHKHCLPGVRHKTKLIGEKLIIATQQCISVEEVQQCIVATKSQQKQQQTCGLLLDPDDPANGDELEEANEKEREGGRELVPHLEQVDSVAQDKRETQQEHHHTDHGCVAQQYTVPSR